MPTRHFNFADLFELAVDKVPDRLALVDARREVTYRELDERSTRLAHTLADLGCEGRRPRRDPGHELHRVGRSRCSRSTRSAASAVNINFRYVEEELRYLFENSDVVACFYQREYGPLVAAAAVGPAPAAALHPHRVERLDRRRLRARPDRVRGRGRGRVRPCVTSPSAPATTSTCSTPAAPPACRRV